MIVKIWSSPNWGDAINSELVRILSGEVPEIVVCKTMVDDTNYIVIGSVKINSKQLKSLISLLDDIEGDSIDIDDVVIKKSFLKNLESIVE